MKFLKKALCLVLALTLALSLAVTAFAAGSTIDTSIDFQLQLEDLSHFPLPDNALVVILTNLIDNAIDACEKIPVEHERFIQLVMKTEEKTAWICIENTTAAPITIQNNYVLTTKDNSLLHGFGLKNVSSLISQHNGSYILDYREKDHRFCFYAKIPVSGYF